MSKFRPKTLEDIIGQETVKSVCKIVVAAAKKNGKPLGHMMFGGPSGFGKTTFCEAIANEMGTNLIQTNAVSLSNINKVKSYVEKIQPGDILFIDEFHGLSQKVCEWLYTVMEDFRYTEDRTGRRMEVPEFTVIAATTEAGDLPEPIKNRFQHIQEFEEYTKEDLIKIVEMILTAHGFKGKNGEIPEKPCEYIASVSRGIPRVVVNNTKWFYDYLTVNKEKHLSLEKMKEIMEMKGVYDHGLTRQDMRYIEQLHEHGQLSLSALSSKVNVSESTIRNDIEPYLQKLDLIDVDSRGRILNYSKAMEMGVLKKEKEKDD